MIEKYAPLAFNRNLSGENFDAGVSEGYNVETGDHLMRFRKRPDQWGQYQLLTGAGVSVPELHQPDEESKSDPEDFELVISSNARPISGQLRLIKRDVDAYSDVFFMAGLCLGDLHASTGHVPTAVRDRQVLASLMLQTESETSRGVEVVLTPPFYLEESTTLDATFLAIKDELVESGLFTEEELLQMLEALSLGRGEAEAHVKR